MVFLVFDVSEQFIGKSQPEMRFNEIIVSFQGLIELGNTL
jgi:hypothetical protein